MIEYIEEVIIVPYVKCARERIGDSESAALVITDNFKGKKKT